MSAAVADLDAPALVAEKVARIQAQIDRWALVAILLGLAFTMVNVQTFAAAGALIWTLPWLAAWLLDPMVSILLLVVVRAEQVTARWQVKMAWQVTATKWVAFAATYVMNTWEPWQSGVAASIVLHSVPPVFVLMGAEVLPALREGLTEAVLKARTYAATAESASGALDLPPLTPPPGGPAAGPATEGGDPTSSPALGEGPDPAATTTDLIEEHAPVGASGEQDLSTTAVNDIVVGIGADPAVRASITGATDRLLEHHTPRTAPDGLRPAPWELPATLENDDDVYDVVDETAGQSPVPAPPVEVTTPITDTPAEPGPGATTDQALPASALHADTDTSRGADDPADPDTFTGEDLEPRVLLLLEQLRTNAELTGPDAEAALQAAGFGPVAARTARRLLSKAREALPRSTDNPQGLDSTTSSTDSTGDDATSAAAGPAGPADDDPDDSADSVPGGLSPALWAPTGTDTGRALALVRPTATRRPGDH